MSICGMTSFSLSRLHPFTGLFAHSYVTLNTNVFMHVLDVGFDAIGVSLFRLILAAQMGKCQKQGTGAFFLYMHAEDHNLASFVNMHVKLGAHVNKLCNGNGGKSVDRCGELAILHHPLVQSIGFEI